MKKRLFTLLLTLCMALTLVPAAAAAKPLLIAPNPNAAPAWLVPQVKEAAEFPDVTGTWCETYVDTVYRSGLMSGKTDTKFDATSPLTHAQITVITARLHDLLNGGDGVLPSVEEGQPWYQSAVNYLNESSKNEVLLYYLKNLEDEDYPNSFCPRGTFVRFLSFVLPDKMLSPINQVDSFPDGGYSEEAFLPFYRAGILSGVDSYGTFHSEGLLTRGAAAAMLARIVDPSQRLTFTLKSFDLCQDVLQVSHETVLLTVGDKEVTAELFADQLCTSLHQWGRQNTTRARTAAIQHWCEKYSFHVLAHEKGLTYSEEKLANLIAAEAIIRDGYLGNTAAYMEFSTIGNHYNFTLWSYYNDLDTAMNANGKWGGPHYQSDLKACAAQLTESAVPTDALLSMDLVAVYDRLEKSPFIGWRFS